jgi:hypothetical protein
LIASFLLIKATCCYLPNNLLWMLSPCQRKRILHRIILQSTIKLSFCFNCSKSSWFDGFFSLENSFR